MSKNSAYALGYAVKSAKQNDAEIVILHVMEVMDTNTYNLLGTKLISEELVAEKTKERIADAKDRIKERLNVF